MTRSALVARPESWTTMLALGSTSAFPLQDRPAPGQKGATDTSQRVPAAFLTASLLALPPPGTAPRAHRS